MKYKTIYNGSILDSWICFWFLARVLDSWKCFWILRCVFGFWEVFMDSGTCFGFWKVFLESGRCFGFWEVFLDSGKCFVPTSHHNNQTNQLCVVLLEAQKYAHISATDHNNIKIIFTNLAKYIHP